MRAEVARRKLTASEIARRTGIHKSTLARRLAGGSEFTIGELVAIAAVLEVPLSTLLPDEPAVSA